MAVSDGGAAGVAAARPGFRSMLREIRKIAE